MSKPKAKWSETAAARRARKQKAREKQRSECETFGLSDAQVHGVDLWSGDVVAMLTSCAMADGIAVSSPARLLAQ